MRGIAIFGAYCLFLISAPTLALACSSCGCSFNSDWSTLGIASSPGFQFDARFSYIDQSVLREHSGVVSRPSLKVPNEQEIQKSTITTETLLGMDYSQTYWGLHLALPYLSRTHSTIAEDTEDLSWSRGDGFGDVTVVARYNGFTPTGDTGVKFGIKLPTGAYRQSFSSGPAEGEPLDRGLQRGTGTTDLIAGVYKLGQLVDQTNYFAHALITQPLNSRDEFRPGTAVVGSAGISYHATQVFHPEIQLNYKHEARESGDNSDRPNSGGNFLYAAGGANMVVRPDFQIYSLIQIPIYQQVNGLQLVPRAIYSIGLRYTF